MQERLEHAATIAREAGKLTLKYFNNSELVVEQKNDQTPVTAADRKAELLLRERIAECFPNDAILGEEFPSQEGTSGYRWILDPIDGTKAFIHGVPLYSTLIGIEYENQPMIGVIRLPALDETLWAMRGKGTWHESPKFPQPQRAYVSKCNDLKKALFLTSTVTTYQTAGRETAFREIAQKTQLTRTWGDAYGYFLVATGRAEVMIDPVMSIWDAAPLLPIFEESGGHFTDWRGNPTITGNEGVATNSLLHDEIIKITKTCLER
ncbi:MAG: histidinol-phosphatase [Planctomycetaceae bacterium]|jgi:histidinol phosphatase-like enzyme (inositol monophosphatase family)|nr:histidinol-phosphatase [Planctomycetaceae bacterium]